MFVDASAIIAIMTSEAEAETFTSLLERADPGSRITSVIAAWEATVGLCRKKRIPVGEAEARVREFIDVAALQLVAVGPDELTVALQAYDRFGRDRYLAAERNRALNLADCFHYACAKTRRIPILHKDAGFGLTDIASVDGPAAG
jgi:ribonuclease VapC